MTVVGSAQQLSFARKTAFAMGDYACNLYWQMVSLFLLYYYTDVVGLSGSTAGVIYLIASVFDGITDPLMGAIADRNRSRMGRFRPYILLGCVPLGLSFILLLWRPPLEGVALLAMIIAANLVFRLCYTIVTVPYTSLTARMTRSSQERSTLAGLRMTFAALASLTVSFLTQPMVAYFGRGDAALGFFYAACVFSLIACCVFPIVYLSTREPAEVAGDIPRLSLRDAWESVRSNRAFWILMLGITFGATSSTALGKAVLYYFKYVVGEAETARYALSLKALCAVAALPCWVYVTKLIGKRNAWMVASAWGVTGVAVLSIARVDTVVTATAFFVFMHIASIGKSMTVWSMLPDTVEYGEWKSGIRAESFIFGFGMFFQKVALGLAAALFGWALDLVGYQANQLQTPETLFGIKMIVVLLPAVGLGGSALVMWLYPLRGNGHERIVEEIAARAPGSGKQGSGAAQPSTNT